MKTFYQIIANGTEDLVGCSHKRIHSKKIFTDEKKANANIPAFKILVTEYTKGLNLLDDNELTFKIVELECDILD